MFDRWSRWAPLTGLLAAVLGVGAAAILVPENQPASDASGMQVIAFYQAHRTGTQVSTILLTLAVAFLVLFAGSLAAGQLKKKPAVIGHSFGGLLAQITVSGSSGQPGVSAV